MDIKPFVLSFWCFCLFLTCVAQTDSGVKKQLKEWLDDSFEYRYSDTDSAFHYGNLVLEQARREGHRDLEADALRSLSTTYQAQGDYQKSLDYAFESIEIARSIEDSLKVGHAQNLIGMVYDEQGNFPMALHYYRQAYEKYKELGDEEWLAMIAINLGILFKGQGDYQKVLPYYQEAYVIYNKIDRPVEAAFAEINLGGVYYFLAKYDSCVYYSLKADENLTKQGYVQTKPTAQCNVGLGYYGLGDYEKALEYLTKALEGHRKYSNKKDLAFVQIHLSKIYDKIGRKEKIPDALLEAKQIAQEIGAAKESMEASELLATYYTSINDYRRAFNAFRDYSEIRDTLFSQDKMKAIKDFQFLYETEKKEQQILLQQAKIRQRNILLIAAVVLLFVVAGAIYLYQNRRKIKVEARLQREATQQVLQAEERERRRIATDLHDGVGQMLSAALLHLNHCVESTEENSDARRTTEKALSLLSESYDEMRNISHQMMPNALIKTGLVSSVREFVDKLNGTKIRITLNIVGLDSRTDEQVETVLYRTIQESVNNVIKHAEATKLSIQLIKDEDGVTVSIEDNGKGFDLHGLGDHKGIGLRNMKSRLALINGAIDIESFPGRGTLVVIHIPYA